MVAGIERQVVEIAETKVAMYDAYASEIDEMTRDEAYLQQHRRSFGSRPIRVVTSGNHGVGHLERKPPDTPEHVKYEQETSARRRAGSSSHRTPNRSSPATARSTSSSTSRRL
jgi:hypothetical protein